MGSSIAPLDFVSPTQANREWLQSAQTNQANAFNQAQQMYAAQGRYNSAEAGQAYANSSPYSHKNFDTAHKVEERSPTTPYPERQPIPAEIDPVYEEMQLLGMTRPLTKERIRAAYRRKQEGADATMLDRLGHAKIRLLMEMAHDKK